MHFVVRRDALCAVAAATVKVAGSAKGKRSPRDCFKLQMQFENGLLRVHAGTAAMSFDAWLPAAFNNIDGSICTDAKEFAHLLRSDTHSELLTIEGNGEVSATAIVGGHTPEGHIPYSEFPCELPIWDAEKLQISPPTTVVATVDLCVLRKAARMAADFCSGSLAQWYIHNTMLIEPMRQGLRFCATNGDLLMMLDAHTGITGLLKKAPAQAFPEVALLCAALDLWNFTADPRAADCEIQTLNRNYQHPDGIKSAAEPLIVLDIAGSGYRIRIVTPPQGAFPEYRKVLGSPGDPGLLFEPNSVELLQVAELAKGSRMRRYKGNIGFHCFFQEPASAVVQLLYAQRMDDSQLNITVRRTNYNYPGVLLGQLEMPTGKERPDPHVTEMISFDSAYVLSILRHLGNRPITVKLKGSAAQMELAALDNGDDSILFVLMPNFRGITEEDL